MKILYVITQAEIGGAQKYVLDLAKHFKGTIVSGIESSELSQQAKELGIQYIGLPELKRDISPLTNLKTIFVLRKVYKTQKPDIVHLNSSMAGFLGSLAAIGLPTKVIYTAHGFVFNEPLLIIKKRVYIFLEKFASLFRDKIITVSDADKLSAVKYHIITPNKLITIHNGLEPINFVDTNMAKTQLGLPLNKFLVVTIANAYPTKGIEVLLSALTYLPHEVINQIHFTIIGDGPLMSSYKTFISEHNLNNITLQGNVPKASEYLKAFDLFILPSRKEGFPYAILEAMQAGLPIIATNVGGVPEALGGAGITINPEDPQELANNIADIYNNKPLQIDLCSKALIQSKLFSLETMLKNTEEVYKSQY